MRSCAQTNGKSGDCAPALVYQQPLKRSQRCCLAWRISVRPKHYEQVRIHPVRPLVSLSRQAGRDFPKWTCPVSTKILSARSLPFRPKHANGFYCAVGTSVISPRWVFTTIFCWFRQAHASSAGDMMAVRQTPFNCSWYGHSKDFHLGSLRSTIIF